MKNIPIVIGFGIITVSQFVLGMFCLIASIKGGGKTKLLIAGTLSAHSSNLFRNVFAHEAETFPPIPFNAYHACAFARHRTLEIAYTGISLIYGLLEPPFISGRHRTG